MRTGEDELLNDGWLRGRKVNKGKHGLYHNEKEGETGKPVGAPERKTDILYMYISIFMCKRK